ncbi:hypothetical protein ANCDUO_24653 [Ancylostoma duodenale]|uniref:Uncharacterized protein n=1 Tax=Ancylostoma duodenale TaxID=51022 RepID=A0A0C2C6Q6_9BILA|nr:hypothetical protein ANCDUO_24653 [Ancylostoma duodenale]
MTDTCQIRKPANSVGGTVSSASKLASIIVFACITNNGKSPLAFVDYGVKINQHNYLNDVLIKMERIYMCSSRMERLLTMLGQRKSG